MGLKILSSFLFFAFPLIIGCQKDRPIPLTPLSQGNLPSKDTTVGNGRAAVIYTLNDSVRFTMVSIPAGTFRMGDSEYAYSSPAHQVTLPGYRISPTEVTQSLYLSVMGVNPSWFDSLGFFPVENVTWFDAVLFCNGLSKKAGRDTVYSYTLISGTPGDSCWDLGNLAYDFSKNGFRLPTEAQWEYACRAGTATAWPWSDAWVVDTANSYCWNFINSNDESHAVAGKRQNAWGLFDMDGNVWEWCNDWSANYTAAPQTDPSGPAGGSYRALRGAAWDEMDEIIFRSGGRNVDAPYNRKVNFGDYGFRIACPE
jgi:formylglycine-generating enzyme required for sulfatase activity